MVFGGYLKSYALLYCGIVCIRRCPLALAVIFFLFVFFLF